MTNANYFVIDAGLNAVEASGSRKHFEQSYGRPLTYLSSDTFATPETHVSEHDALSYSPVFTGISLISGDISGMPWVTKRTEGDGDTVDATNHETYGLLRYRTGNDQWTANLFVEAIIARAIFYGIGAARIYRGGPLHRPTRLELIRNRVTPVDRIHTGRKHRFYEYTDDLGHFHQVTPENMFVLNGPTLDAFHGMGLYDYAIKTLSRANNANSFVADFFSGKGVPKGFFVHPGTMSEPAQERFYKNMQAYKNRTFGLLEEDMKWQQSGINPVDAMMVDLLQLTETDVSRFLKIPPGKLAVRGGQTGTTTRSVEQEQQDYLSSCLLYWILRLQREADDKLFREDEKGTYFTKFDTSEFQAMAATRKEQAEADRIDILGGVTTINETRRKRGLNHHTDGVGDKPLLPLNMTTNPAVLDQANGTSAGGIEPATEGDTGRSVPGLDAILRRDMQRATTRLVTFARKAAKKPGNYLQRINDLRQQHGQAVSDIVQPIGDVLASTLQREGTTDLIVDRIFEAAENVFVRAAECQADQLETSVTESAEEFRAMVAKVADSFCEV